MPFRYLCDPLFLFCFTLYWVNRLIVEQLTDIPFFHFYLNDLICIPFLVPILLYGLKRLHLRPHDRPPQSYEIILPLIVWSIMFEILLPQHPYWSQWLTGDPYDVFCYTLSASAAMTFWGWYYPRPEKEVSTGKVN
jgi:hypothetical protein